MKERLKNAYSAVRKEFRAVFEIVETPVQTEDVLDDDERNRVYEMKASTWYQVTYHPKWVQRWREALEPDREEEEDASARLSFAWISVEHLVRIKIRCRGGAKAGRWRPIERLAAYMFGSL
ncbi:unnamed protein product [Triticum turgidum subsp. durum]|uniref:RDRP C-terminal head domain-containing protein n=1 Tax=Triticum turgidum subsp. durum TaxID=4567 RepID=A0A9R1QZE5_TRITD|nr:unnamed protein product [Triticum turgidum subsp. durum]